jgi:hypothetical protein
MSSGAVRGVALERNAQGNQRRKAQCYEPVLIAFSNRHGEALSMPSRIDDYAIIGDLHTTALVGADGSVDWLCFPRCDSPACFAALLGDDFNGCWRLAPASGGHCTRRRYREKTLVLETEWETLDGAITARTSLPRWCQEGHHSDTTGNAIRCNAGQAEERIPA